MIINLEKKFEQLQEKDLKIIGSWISIKYVFDIIIEI
jgi:hypothetical protein